MERGHLSSKNKNGEGINGRKTLVGMLPGVHGGQIPAGLFGDRVIFRRVQPPDELYSHSRVPQLQAGMPMDAIVAPVDICREYSHFQYTMEILGSVYRHRTSDTPVYVLKRCSRGQEVVTDEDIRTALEEVGVGSATIIVDAEMNRRQAIRRVEPKVQPTKAHEGTANLAPSISSDNPPFLLAIICVWVLVSLLIISRRSPKTEGQEGHEQSGLRGEGCGSLLDVPMPRRVWHFSFFSFRRPSGSSILPRIRLIRLLSGSTVQ